MAYTKKGSVKQLDELLELMEFMEVDIFGEDRQTISLGFYGGKKYRYCDWVNMKKAVQQVQKVYQGGTNKSYRYILKNTEYNNLLRNIYYYKSKKNKTQKDYDKLERNYKRLAEIREIKKKEKEEKLLKKQKETEELERKLFGEEGENLYDIKL